MLTDDDFTYGGVDYDVIRLDLFGGTLRFTFNKAIPDSLKSALTLHVDNRQLPLADATLTNSDTRVAWTNSGLNWSVGDTVSLRLTETPPTTLTLRASGPLREGGNPVTITGTFDPPLPRAMVLGTYYEFEGSGYEDLEYIDPGPGVMPQGTRTFTTKLGHIDDDIVEREESFSITYSVLDPALGQTSSAVVAEATITLVMTDDDRGRLTLTADRTPAEGADGGGRVTISVTLDNPAPVRGTRVEIIPSGTAQLAPLITTRSRTAFDYESSDIGSSGGYDDGQTDGRRAFLHIAEGETEAAFTIFIIDDAVVDPGETIIFTASSESPDLDATLTLTIRDNDAGGGSGQEEGPIGVLPEPEDSGQPEEEDSQQQQQGEHADLIAQMYEWRNDPESVDNKTHTDRWDRALLAFGETVADASLTPMTADEAQALADRGWSRWQQVADALRDIESGGQQETPNQAPTVSAALGDATIVNESGTREVSLSGVFADADADELTITAASSDEAVATVSVAADQSSLTVNAQARGTATITVTANDGNGGVVEDAFTVAVKAAPVVASALADVTDLPAGDEQFVLLSGAFSDADGDALTITAASSDDAKATVTVSADQFTLTVAGVAEGTATITVTAEDADGNRVSDAFDVSVVKTEEPQDLGQPEEEDSQQQQQGEYAELIAQIYEWRNDPKWVDDKTHTDRWDRALLAFGETVSDASLTPMTASEAQSYADKGWQRWVEVAKALRDIEGG